MRFVAGQCGALQFDVEALREQRGETLRQLRGTLRIARQQRLADGAFDEAQTVHIPLQPGQMSLHA